jgi:putative SOS response-associated peptidase YedK
MCFHSFLSKPPTELENRFNAKFENQKLYKPGDYNGFQHPKTPVVANNNKDLIQFFSWGLIPIWAKDKSIQKQTLNARIETIAEKPSFRNLVNNRCLILADGFYEWKWLDSKGKNKEKYLITLSNKETLAFAGLYNIWVDNLTGEILKTYTILTMEANELMSEIHNSKKRMPVILNPYEEQNWLNGEEYQFKNIELTATEIPKNNLLF